MKTKRQKQSTKKMNEMPHTQPWSVCLLSACILLGCGGADQAPKDSSKDADAAGHNSYKPLSAPVDYIGSVHQASVRATQTIDRVQLQQAIEQFRLLEGKPPEELKQLVEAGFLAKVPVAPKGMRIDYQAQSGRVEIVPLRPTDRPPVPR